MVIRRRRRTGSLKPAEEFESMICVTVIDIRREKHVGDRGDVRVRLWSVEEMGEEGDGVS